MAAVHDRELPTGWLMEKSLWRGVAIYWLALAMRKAPKKAIVLQMAIVDAWITWILIASSSFSNVFETWRTCTEWWNPSTVEESVQRFADAPHVKYEWSTLLRVILDNFLGITRSHQSCLVLWMFFLKVFQSVGFLIIINHPNWRWCFRGVAKNHQPEGNRFTYIYYIIKPHGGAISMAPVSPWA